MGSGMQLAYPGPPALPRASSRPRARAAEVRRAANRGVDVAVMLFRRGKSCSG